MTSLLYNVEAITTETEWAPVEAVKSTMKNLENERVRDCKESEISDLSSPQAAG